MTDMMKQHFLHVANDKYHNYIFVQYIDDIFINYLKNNGGSIIQRTKDMVKCGLYGELWIVKKLTKNNARGCKPRKLILDSRLSDELIEESGIIYNLIVCVHGEVF